MKLSANLSRQRAIHRSWHRYQSRCHILRAQLGFEANSADRPLPCIGCCHYHGKAYGNRREQRLRLVCGFHPYGWTASDHCPDWQGSEN